MGEKNHKPLLWIGLTLLFAGIGLFYLTEGISFGDWGHILIRLLEIILFLTGMIILLTYIKNTIFKGKEKEFWRILNSTSGT